MRCIFTAMCEPLLTKCNGVAILFELFWFTVWQCVNRRYVGLPREADNIMSAGWHHQWQPIKCNWQLAVSGAVNVLWKHVRQLPPPSRQKGLDRVEVKLSTNSALWCNSLCL